ncbi:MAG: hypothetical protein HY232_18370 [Acidobacteria bacterium]|nr:hypothetical protein [Acidobacteriota bacterium]
MSKTVNTETWQRRAQRADEKIHALQLRIDDYASRLSEASQRSVAGSSSVRGMNRPSKRQGSTPSGKKSYKPSTDRLADLEQKKAKAARELQQAIEAKRALEEEARKAGILPGVLRGQVTK